MIKENYYGLSAKFVSNADFDGKYELPVIHQNEDIVIPEDMIPFDKRNVHSGNTNYFVNFYLDDDKFKQILTKPDKYIKELDNFQGVISPDFSLYRDMPYTVQLSNTYRNRAFGCYMQSKGLYVIPNVRWSDSRSFEYCFDGLEKNGMYCISTHGCIKRIEDKHYFRQGLATFLDRLNPKIVLVYGAMPEDIFSEYESSPVQFVNYQSYTSKVYAGGVNGNRI